jgi:hypothetical protein
MTIVKDESLSKEPIAFIQKLLDFIIETNKIVGECFENHYQFKHT